MGESSLYLMRSRNFQKIGVKSTVLELQKSLKYKSSSLINFQINGTIFLQKSRFPGFTTKIRYSRRKLIEGKSHFSYNPLLGHSALPPKTIPYDVVAVSHFLSHGSKVNRLT